MNRWMVSAALIAAAGVLYAETVRFDDEPQKMLTVKTRRKEMKTVPLFDGGGRTKFQTFNLNPAGQHCGFLLVGSRRKLHLLTRGDTVNYVPLSGGEEAIGPIAPKLSGTLSNAWTKLELEYRGGFIEISCNRKYVGSIDFDLGELAEYGGRPGGSADSVCAVRRYGRRGAGQGGGERRRLVRTRFERSGGSDPYPAERKLRDLFPGPAESVAGGVQLLVPAGLGGRGARFDAVVPSAYRAG